MIVEKYRNAEYTAASCKFGGGVKSFLGCRKNIYLAGGNQYWVDYWVEYRVQYWVEYRIEYQGQYCVEYWVEYLVQYWVSILG